MTEKTPYPPSTDFQQPAAPPPYDPTPQPQPGYSPQPQPPGKRRNNLINLKGVIASKIVGKPIYDVLCVIPL